MSVVHRAGFVALVGRPNVGKSTLLNRLVGEKMAIVSRRPQTTRTRITGIKHLPQAQIVFVDTPGLHTGTGRLGELMVKTAERAVEDVDVVCLVLEATERPERLDGALFERLRGGRCPVYAVVNKTDLAPHVGADLEIMRSDTARARGERPYVFTDLTRLVGVDDVARFIAKAGGLPAPMSAVA